MAAGTKIFLAVAALLVVILVAYYSVNSPDAQQLSVESSTPPVESRNETPPPRPEPRVILPEPEPEPIEAPAPPVEEAPATEHAEEVAPAPEMESSAGPLPDHPPVQPVEGEVSDGGKDAPDEPVPVKSEPTKDDAPAAPSAPAPQPRSEQPPAPRPAPLIPPPTVEYTVKEGDTMSSIAANWFDDAGKWDLIAKANPFIDPDRLSVGQVLRLPPKDAQREEITTRVGSISTVYVVRSGDTLSRIASAYYSNAALWRVIYEANRATIGPSPNTLRPGMRLTIPPAPKPAAP